MSKFTPGPWVNTQGRATVTYTYGVGPTFNGVGPVFGRCEESDANARLIAASPELYVTLRRIVRINRGLEAWHEDAMPAAIVDAEALLARIDGE